MSDEPREMTETEIAIGQAQDRYVAAMHAMQSGVSIKQGLNPKDMEPKDLRVGINSALSQAGAIVKLLMAKGVITQLEWFEALADAAEYEVQIYTDQIKDITGTNITLV